MERMGERIAEVTGGGALTRMPEELLTANLWDVLPLLFAKASAPEAWDRAKAACELDEKDLARLEGRVGEAYAATLAAEMAESIDEALGGAIEGDDRCQVFEHFSYSDAELSLQELRAVIAAVEAVPEDSIDESMLVDAYRCHAEPLDPETRDDLLPPDDLVDVMAAIAGALWKDRIAGSGLDATIYSPCTMAPNLVAALTEACPEALVFGQDADVQNVYMTSMCSALGGYEAKGACGIAIGQDAFTEASPAALSVSIIPLETDHDVMFDSSDPRWRYGVVPKGRETYAWIEQALAHLDSHGYAVLCVPTDALSTTHVQEFPIRSALVESGRVYASISLPGRLFQRTSAVGHLVVMGPERPAKDGDDCPVLFIDAQECGVEFDGSLRRRIPDGVKEHIAETFGSYLAGGRPREIRFAALAQPKNIIGRNCDLTASSYIYSPEKIATQKAEVLEEGLERLIDELENDAARIAELDVALMDMLKGMLQ